MQYERNSFDENSNDVSNEGDANFIDPAIKNQQSN